MINDEITRIENAKNDITQSIESKGVQIPDGTKIDKLNVYIDEINQGGGPQVQSDWDVTDSTNPAFIKNKPFGEKIVEKTIFSDTLEFGDGGVGFFVSGAPFSEEIKDNAQLTVNWDGNTYQTTAKYNADADGYTFGNLSIVNMGEDTKEPFFFGYSDGSLEIVTMETKLSHTISISGLLTEITKISERFLPTIKQPIYIEKFFEEWTTDEWELYKNLCREGNIIFMKAGKSSSDYDLVLGVEQYYQRGKTIVYMSGTQIIYRYESYEGSNHFYMDTFDYRDIAKLNDTITSPNGTEFKIIVDDNGNLTTEKIV